MLIREQQPALTLGFWLAPVVAITVAVGCNSSSNQLTAGINAVKAGDFDLALKILRPLADNGDPRAAVEMGNVYAFGWGVRVDDAVAEEWFRRAEAKGITRGQSHLDVAYELAAGHGMKRDPGRAREWLQKAANLGSAKASELLANSQELKRLGIGDEPTRQ